MITLLIADDEELERQAVKKLISDNFLNEIEVYEARNGREAISVGSAVKPDVVIMDLKMPGISGMEAIRELKKFLTDCYFMVLTAYDYFSYAKEALENNVKEFLLKPLKRDELINKVNSAVNYVKKVKAERDMALELKEKLYNMLPIIENELVKTIINNSLSYIDYKTYMKYLNIESESGFVIVLKFIEEFEVTKNALSERGDIKDKLKNYVKEKLLDIGKVLGYSSSKEDKIFFIVFSENEEFTEIKDSFIISLKNLEEKLQWKFNVSMTLGIGRLYQGLENLYKSYQEAELAAKNSKKPTSIVCFKDIIRYNNTLTYESEENLKNDKGSFAVYDSNVRNENIKIQNKIIEKAGMYIQNNYQHEISIEDVAKYVSLSPYYFSKVFKSIKGKNYVDYLTEIRINNAIKMLKEGNFTVKEVCYEVGYSDPNYFSRVFKKYTGSTPSEYRNT